MSKQTLIPKKQQLTHSLNGTILIHKWNTNGHGSSRFLTNSGDVISEAGGCGYDRRGTAFGDVIEKFFPNELEKLAKRECKGKRKTYKTSKKFYGLFYNSKDDKVLLDGGCGWDCMVRILNKIGFSVEYNGESEKGRTGEQFFKIVPLKSNDRYWLK